MRHSSAVKLLPPLALAAATLGAVGEASAASYEQPGPLQVAVENVQTQAVSGKVAYPTTGTGPFPTLILGHGAVFANADQQIGWGQHFASYGFVAFAVQLGSFPDANGGAAVIQAALTHLQSAQGPLAGLADTSVLGLEGFSAGGQSFAVAASTLNPDALVLFDPVAGGMGGGTEPASSAVPNICSPTISIFTEPGGCNNQGNWVPFALSSTGPRAKLKITGAVHCDGENADRGPLCGTFCGGQPDPAKGARFAHYGTAWFLAYLKNDADALAEVTASALSSDTTISETSTADGPSCTNTGTGGAGGTSGAAGAAGAGAGGTGAQPGTGGTGAEPGTGGAGAQPGTGGSGAAPGTGGMGGVPGTGGTDPGAGGTDPGAGGSTAGSGGSTSGGFDGSDDDSGCTCTLPGSPSRRGGAAALLALLGVSLLRRRRA